MKIRVKTVIPIFSFIVFLSHLQAQHTAMDSLQNRLLLHTEKDTIRVNILNDLAFTYYQNDSTKTLTYLEESEVLADLLNFSKGKARSLYVKGVTKAAQSNSDEALQYFNEALQLYKKINYKKGISKCYTSMGILFYNRGDQKQAITYYLKSIDINEEIGNKRGVNIILNKIGNSYSETGNYAEAGIYFKKALQGHKEVHNEKGVSNCLNNLGNIYSHQANYPLALEYYSKSLVIDEKLKDTLSIAYTLNNIGIIYKNTQNYDKAIEAYEKSLKIARKNGNKKNITEILNNLGLVYKSKKNYTTAHKFLKDALMMSEEMNNKVYIATCLNNIGDVFLELKDYKAAHQHFDKGRKNNLEAENQRGLCKSYLGIAIAYANQKFYDKALINALKSKEISSEFELLDYQRDVSELLSTVYKNLGDYKKAFSSHQQFKILNDSIFNKKNIQKITQLEYEYKYKQQLDSASFRELKLTKTVTETNRDLAKSQRNYLWAIIGVLLVSIVFGSILFYQKFKNIKTKNENIVMEQKLLRSQMTPHFIFNSLSVLQGMILNKDDKKSVAYLSKFSKLLRITLENSRDKTVRLSEEMTAVENYLALQNLEDEAYLYTILVDDGIDTTSFKIPPMLIQPFIENAVAHAFPDQKENRKIDVRLKCIAKKLICTITDNGIGIDSQKAAERKDKKSLATTITSERLELLAKDLKMQGSVTVEDRKKYNEQGTVVTLVIPYKMLS